MNRKRIVIIAVLIIAVITVFAGKEPVRNKMYTYRLDHAQELVKQGNYSDAETEYAAAVSISKSKPEAREGLAFVYVIENQFQLASKEYKTLFRLTGDDKYKAAAESAEHGVAPQDPELAVETPWHKVSLADAPYNEMLESFVSQTAWPADKKHSYDSAQNCSPEELYILMEKVYLGSWWSERTYYGDDPEEFNEVKFYGDGEEGTDPRGWFEYGHYARISKEHFEFCTKEILNFSDEQLDKVMETGKKEHSLYEEDGFYYWDTWPCERIEYGSEIISIMTNGLRYCVLYDTGGQYPFDDITGQEVDYDSKYYSYYEMLEYRKINDSVCLTMLSNTPYRPAETFESSEYSDEVNAAYAKVLRNHERQIKAYIWPYDEDYKKINPEADEYGYTPYLEYPMNKSVVIRDLNGDDIPELIFMASHQRDRAQMHIYTYKNGRAEECKYRINSSPGYKEDFFEDFLVGGEAYCAVYTGREDGTLYTITSYFDDGYEFICNKIKMDKEGNIEQEAYIYEHYNEWEGDEPYDEYVIDGKNVTEKEGKDAVKAIAADLDDLLLYDGVIDRLSKEGAVQKSEPAGMTFEEAMKYLADK